MAAARHVRIALFFHPKLNTTASSPSPGTQSLKRCALSQETELPGTHPIPTIGLLPIFPPAPTPTPPLHATQHFVQEALLIGFAMNKALSIGQQGCGFAVIGCWRRGRASSAEGVLQCIEVFSRSLGSWVRAHVLWYLRVRVLPVSATPPPPLIGVMFEKSARPVVSWSYRSELCCQMPGFGDADGGSVVVQVYGTLIFANRRTLGLWEQLF